MHFHGVIQNSSRIPNLAFVVAPKDAGHICVAPLNDVFLTAVRADNAAVLVFGMLLNGLNEVRLKGDGVPRRVHKCDHLFLSVDYDSRRLMPAAKAFGKPPLAAPAVDALRMLAEHAK